MAIDPVTAKFLVSTGVSVLGSLFGRKKRRKELKAANAERRQMKQQYMNLDFSNPYQNLSNPYSSMENPMEDLTVNLKQAEFKAEQQAQRDVNVLDALRGSAGASGAAGLAQTVYNQKVKKGQEASASIGMQESANQRAASMAQMKMNQLEAGQEAKNQFLFARGERETQKMEQDRTETLYGMSMQRAAAAQQAKNAATKSLIGGVGSALTGYAGTAVGAGNLDNFLKGNPEGGPGYSWNS